MRRRKAGKYSSSWIRANLRWAIYIRDGFTCAWCGCVVEDSDLTLDHLFPRGHRARDNHPSRLTVACVSCNLSRKGMLLTPWLRKLRKRGTLDTALAALRRRHRPLDRVAGELLRREVRHLDTEAASSFVPAATDWFVDDHGVCW